MERVRSTKITIVVDTNKQTYTETFTSIAAANDWYEEMFQDADIGGDPEDDEDEDDEPSEGGDLQDDD